VCTYQQKRQKRNLKTQTLHLVTRTFFFYYLSLFICTTLSLFFFCNKINNIFFSADLKRTTNVLHRCRCEYYDAKRSVSLLTDYKFTSLLVVVPTDTYSVYYLDSTEKKRNFNCLISPDEYLGYTSNQNSYFCCLSLSSRKKRIE
jgi:hypothetical protein